MAFSDTGQAATDLIYRLTKRIAESKATISITVSAPSSISGITIASVFFALPCLHRRLPLVTLWLVVACLPSFSQHTRRLADPTAF